MKQKNLDELRNIYLGLVTGGEGPEVLYEDYLEEAPVSRAQPVNQDVLSMKGGIKGTGEGEKFVANPKGWTAAATARYKTVARAQPVNQDVLSMKGGIKGTGEGKKFVANPKGWTAAATTRYYTQKPPVKPKPFEYNKTNLGTEQDAAFRAGGGNASVGDAYTAADVVARGRAALKAKAAAEASRNGSSGSGGPTPTPTPAAPRPAATTTPKPTTPTPTTAPKPAGSAMDQWTRANPTLAAKVKPGQSGYDTIKTRLSADNDRGPSTPTPNPVKANVPGFALGGKPTPPTPPTPAAAEPSGETDRLKKALDIKKSDVTSSYQFPMSKTLRDLSDSYNEIYEAKKQVDQDEDGDNDFADNMIARMVASGMSREEAIKKVKNKDYNKKDELDEGIGSAIRGLFGRSKPKQSRGEELRSKYGSPDSRPSRYKITLKSSGEEAAKKVLDAGGSIRNIHPRDTGSNNPGNVTSGEYGGMGNRANRRMGKPPEDTRDRESEVAMGIESKVKRGHIDSRGVKKPIARINADFEMWVDGLLNEGYDLSEYTWDEMSEIYFDEATAMSKRGNQRARAALTPNERKQLNMEYDLYDLIQSHLLEYGFADTEEGANMIIENMSPSWIKQILSED